MANMKTDITVVLDRSGSMGVVAGATIEGFNQFVADQKKEDGDAVMTLVQFDHEYEVVYSGVDIQGVENLEFKPRGSTALFDAIGRAIGEAEERLKEHPAEKIVVMILTDGYENASQEFNRHTISKLIESKEKENWTFVYLGANQDARKEAELLNIPVGNAVNYAANSVGTRAAFAGTSNALRAYRSSESVQCSSLYSDTQRAEIESHVER